jgi:hypothetical protein
MGSQIVASKYQLLCIGFHYSSESIQSLRFMLLKSLRMVAGHSPYSAEPPRLGWFMQLRLSLFSTKPNQFEFITLTAWKRGT